MFWTQTPRQRRRFFDGPINGTFLEHAHRFRHSPVELRIATSDDIFGPVLNIDVGRHTFVLYRPAVIPRKETTGHPILVAFRLSGLESLFFSTARYSPKFS